MTRFYDIDAAEARLVEVRPLLEGLRADRDEIARRQAELARLRGTNGDTSHARAIAEEEAAIRQAVGRMEAAVARLTEWDVALRDIGTGLIDFPALVSGRPVWLCWRLGEDSVAWWHEFDRGFDARRPLAELA